MPAHHHHHLKLCIELVHLVIRQRGERELCRQVCPSFLNERRLWRQLSQWRQQLPRRCRQQQLLRSGGGACRGVGVTSWCVVIAVDNNDEGRVDGGGPLAAPPAVAGMPSAAAVAGGAVVYQFQDEPVVSGDEHLNATVNRVDFRLGHGLEVLNDSAMPLQLCCVAAGPRRLAL
jgi:hypothetical protein